MRTRASLLVGSLATLLLLGSAAGALADASMASDTSVYDKPHGTEIDTIDMGDTVAVFKCQGGYCYVHDVDDDSTDDGWVKSGAIDFTGTTGNEDDVSSGDDNDSLISLDHLPDRHRHR